MKEIGSRLRGKRVLITGVCNSIGQEFLVKLLKLSLGSLIGLGNRRSDLFYLGERYSSEKRLRLYHGDVENREFLVQHLAGVDIVIHAPSFGRDSLYKFGAESFAETLVRGTGTMVEAARANGVEQLLVAFPQETTHPNATIAEALREAEWLVTCGNLVQERPECAYFSVRLGNMIDRPGATFPSLERQVAAGGPVMLTSGETTAFVTTLNQAVDRALSWLFLAKDGEVHVNRMPAFRFLDLAEVMIAALAPLHGQRAREIALECSSRLEGEPQHEELMNPEEAERALEYENRFVLCQLKSARSRGGVFPPVASGLKGAYRSDQAEILAFDALWQYLVKQGLLPDREFSYSPADDMRMFP